MIHLDGIPTLNCRAKSLCSLQADLHDKTLQVPRLRHSGKDGMVGTLAPLFDKPDVSLGVARRRRSLLM